MFGWNNGKVWTVAWDSALLSPFLASGEGGTGLPSVMGMVDDSLVVGFPGMSVGLRLLPFALMPRGGPALP